jgi:hypothetical protein
MDSKEEYLKKRIRVYKTLLGLNPSPENNFNTAKREVEVYKMINDLLSRLPGDELSRLFWDSLNEDVPHFPDEN